MHDPHLITSAQPNALFCAHGWAHAQGLLGSVECRALLGCSSPPLPASLTHPCWALCTLYPHPGEPSGPGWAAAERREGRRGAQATPARHCPAAEEKLLEWSQEWWGLVVPGTACSHMAAPGAPWHSPQQILLVQLHPLSRLFDVGLALVPAPVPIPIASSHGQTVVVPLALSWPDCSSGVGHWGYTCSLNRVLSGSETPGTKQPAFMPLIHPAPQTQWLYPNYLACCSGSCHRHLTETHKPKESKKSILWWGALPRSKDWEWRT